MGLITPDALGIDRRQLIAMAATPLTPTHRSPSPVSAAKDKLYIGQAARLSARIPADWTCDGTTQTNYRGEDGFIFSYPMRGTSLDEASQAVSELMMATSGPIMHISEQGMVGRQIDGMFSDRPARATILPHPTPFFLYSTKVAFVVVIADPDHNDQILSSLSFDPALITPTAYLSGIIDILEATAWYGTGIDWEWIRTSTLQGVEGLTTLESVQGSVLNLLALLRAAGDNHSYVLLPDNASALQERRGFGMLVGGTRILAVYEGSPAAKAGLRDGDEIELVNGDPPAPENGLDPGMPSTYSPSMWESPAALVVRRAEESEPIRATVASASYEFYRPPRGHRLPEGIGYLEIPEFRIPGREQSFATIGNALLAQIDQQPLAGWIVDLRLNFGGGYSPMVTAVAALLGNTTIVSWLSRQGVHTWIAMHDGAVLSDGKTIADYLVTDGVTRLNEAAPRVAVLTGRYTSSSGEVAALAFVGRPNTRRFGDKTGGFTTANQLFWLFDGTQFGLAVSAMTDRNGEIYPTGLAPDEVIPIDWAAFGTEQDPVIAAAIDWLAGAD